MANERKFSLLYLLEHLFLHLLICEYPAENKNENEQVGIGGVVDFIVPELNDVQRLAFKTSLATKLSTAIIKIKKYIYSY